MSDSELDRMADIPDPLGGSTAIPLDAGRVEGLARRVLEEKSPSRAEVVRGRIFALLLALFWCIAELGVLGLRGDLGELPTSYVLAWLLSPLALAAVAAYAAVYTGESGLGVRVSIAVGLAVMGPLAIALLAMLLRDPTPVPPTTSFWRGVAVCLELTLAGAAAPLAFAVLSFRRAFVANARFRSALLGAAAGLVAGAVMNAHCPNGVSMHLVLGHALPIALATVFGALVGYKLTRS